MKRSAPVHPKNAETRSVVRKSCPVYLVWDEEVVLVLVVVVSVYNGSGEWRW
jgi:hypothetical protein